MKKLNIFDWLIFVVVAVIIVGVVFRADIERTVFSDEKVELTLTVKVEFLENSRAATIKDGDSIFTSKGKDFGTVAKVSSTPSRDIVTVNGIDTYIHSAICKDLSIDITLNGYITDGEYFSENGTRLLINDTIILETDTLSLNCRITEVKKNEEQ